MSRSAQNFARIISCLIVLLLAAMWISLVLGSTRMSGSELVAALFGRGEDANPFIIFQLRMPRMIVGLLVGSGTGRVRPCAARHHAQRLGEPKYVGHQ